MKTAQEQGYEVTTYNSKQLKEYDKQYKEERAENDRFQNFQWYNRHSSGKIVRPRYGNKGH